MSKTTIFAVSLFYLISFGSSLHAIEVAPRISDREIIQTLAELKAGQKVLESRFIGVDQRFDDLRSEMNQNFKQVDKRFEQIDKRFEQIDRRFDQVDKRFEQVDKRFNELRSEMNQRFDGLRQEMNQRFSDMFLLLITGFGTMFGGIFGLIGFIIWDRTQASKEIKKEVEAIAREERILPQKLLGILQEYSQSHKDLSVLLHREHLDQSTSSPSL